MVNGSVQLLMAASFAAARLRRAYPIFSRDIAGLSGLRRASTMTLLGSLIQPEWRIWPGCAVPTSSRPVFCS
jgi:hypothetical protein